MSPGRWAAALGVAALAVVWLGWGRSASDAAPASEATAPMASLRPAPVVAAAPGPSAQTAPLSAEGIRQREAQRQLAQQRLDQAREALATYEAHARYPHQSRPAREHPDQLQPFLPIAEEHPLRTPGGTPMDGVKLRTTQERVFTSGDESSRVTVSLVNAQNQALPLRFTRAVIQEVTEPGRTAQTVGRPLVPTDDGQAGDEVAGDGVYTATMAPSRQGFNTFAGRVRLELWMSYGGQPGFIYFDLMHDPGTAGRWLPGVTESVQQGALALDLRLEVQQPGRYVVNGRIDDASGKPIALALFNDELKTGVQTVRLWVHGRLLHDLKPAFPLTLRDVDGFLLRENTFPDRVMLPRLAGSVHRTQNHVLSRFSPDAWPSEQRDRYLAELRKDVDTATDALKRLGGGP
ncbi:MAG: choice-of-anchor X domain-containing protein [Inhella sp.]|uniref:choice-of-anchor X domain-containing protein n=1 Tax=Inhella sp. TaxID=1921806 RepID=UPI00391AA538